VYEQTAEQQPRRNAEGSITAFGGPLRKTGRGRPVKLFTQAFYTQFWEERVPWPEALPQLPRYSGDMPYMEGAQAPSTTVTAAPITRGGQQNTARIEQGRTAARDEATNTSSNQAPAGFILRFDSPPDDSIADLVQGLPAPFEPDERDYRVEDGHLVAIPESEERGTGLNDHPHGQMGSTLPTHAFYRCHECRTYVAPAGRCLFCGNAVTAVMAVGQYMGRPQNQEERASGSDAALTLSQCGSLGCQIWSPSEMLQVSIRDMAWKGTCPRCRVYQEDWGSRATITVYKPIGAP